MKVVESLLDRFIELLKEEKGLLIKTLSDSKYSEELARVSEEKKVILSKTSTLERSDLEPYKEKFQQIQQLSNTNMQLAHSNILFIEDLFESIFEDSAKQYNNKGTVATKKEGLFNKKI